MNPNPTPPPPHPKALDAQGIAAVDSMMHLGVTQRRTDKRNQWGQLWVTSGGKLCSYGSQVYVKPVYTYAQAQKLMKNGAEHE